MGGIITMRKNATRFFQLGAFPVALVVVASILLFGISADHEGRLDPGRVLPREKVSGRQQAGQMARNRMVDPQARAALGPLALAVESTLSSARQQLEGLKREADLLKNSGISDDSLLQALRTELGVEIKAASRRQQEMKNLAELHPGFVAKEELLGATQNVNELTAADGLWQARAGAPGYWKNVHEARKDLENLEKKLNAALESARSFDNAHLGLSITEG